MSEKLGYELSFDVKAAIAAATSLDEKEKLLAQDFIKVKKAAEEKAKALGITTGEMKKLEAELDGASQKAKSTADGFGKMGQNSSKLAGALGMLSPMAGSSAQSIADLADVGEFGAEMMELLGLSALELVAIIGPLAIGVGALAAVFMVQARNAEMAAERTAFLRKEAAELTEITNKTTDARLKQAVAEGRLSQAQADQIQISRDATREVFALSKAQAEEKKKAEEALNFNTKVSMSLEDLASTGNLAAMGVANAAEWLGGYSKKADEANFKLADLADSLDSKARAVHEGEVADKAAAKAIADKAAADKAAADAAEAARKAEEAARKAAQKRAEADALLVEGIQKLLALDKDYRASQAQVQKIADSAANSQLTGIEKVTAAEQAKLQELKALHEKQFASARGVIERQLQADLDYKNASLAVTKAAEEERASIRAAFAEKASDIANSYTQGELTVYEKIYEEKKKVLADYLEAATAAGRSEAEIAQVTADIQIAANERVAKAKMENERKVVQASLQAAGQAAKVIGDAAALAYSIQADTVSKLQQQLDDGESNLTQKQKIAIEARIKQTKEGAKRAFAIMKAARIAEAAISTASAAIAAYNAGLQVGGPAGLILGPVMAGVAVAAGAVQIASIASEQPSFFRGTSEVPGALSDEVPATLHTREAVVSRQGADLLGRDAIRNANEGKGGGTQKVVLVNQYQHQVFRPFIKKDLLLGGPLADAIRGKAIVGHREVR